MAGSKSGQQRETAMEQATKVSGQAAFVSRVVQVLRDMDGIGKASAVKAAIASRASESGETLDDSELSTGAVKWENDVHWARMHLVNAGMLEPAKVSGVGIWKLTEQGWAMPLTPAEAAKIVGKKLSEAVEKQETDGQQDAFEDWQQQLKVILQSMSDTGFERLCAEIMTRNGLEAKATGKTGDKGIDGEGFFPIDKQHLIGIQVAWQCKRYAGTTSVRSPEVRDFRGAMHTQIDHGVIFTTSKFTAEAQAEARSPGKRTIKLVDLRGVIDLVSRLAIGVELDADKKEVVGIKAADFQQFMTSKAPAGQASFDPA